MRLFLLTMMLFLVGCGSNDLSPVQVEQKYGVKIVEDGLDDTFFELTTDVVLSGRKTVTEIYGLTYVGYEDLISNRYFVVPLSDTSKYNSRPAGSRVQMKTIGYVVNNKATHLYTVPK